MIKGSIHKIKFIFENCEIVEIDSYHCFRFIMENIKHNYFKRWVTENLKAVSECENLAIAIYRDAAEEKVYQGKNYISGKCFERLQKFKDITHIQFKGEYENHEIHIDYDGGPDGTGNNIDQYVYLNSKGDLFLIISKNEEFKRKFLEYIENTESIEKYYNDSNEEYLIGYNEVDKDN